MKKEMWVAAGVLVLVVVGVLGYTNKHAIKEMLMGSSAPVPTQSSSGSAVYATPSSSVVASASADLLMTKTDSKKGSYLVSSTGMTLYTYDKDTKGGTLSNCNGGCAQAWPPYVTAVSPLTMPTGLSLVKRADGTWQYAYKGWPVYYYATDTKAGDMTGDGVGGVWHLVKP